MEGRKEYERWAEVPFLSTSLSFRLSPCGLGFPFPSGLWPSVQVSFPFRSLPSFVLISVSVSVSVLSAAGKARKRHDTPHETKQGHGVFLNQFRKKNFIGLKINYNLHFVILCIIKWRGGGRPYFVI
jgi:hypothetical protein